MKDVKLVSEEERKAEAKAAAVDSQLAKLGESKDYNKEVNDEVRKNYSVSEELAIFRHALKALVDKGVLNGSEEFVNYNAIIEQCKLNAKKQH
jgi:hypothetical protein